MAEQNTLDHYGRWNWLVQETHERLKAEGKLEGDELINAILHQSLRSFLLICYSEEINREQGRPWAPLSGRAGSELKAVQVHHWTPAEVRPLSDDDLYFALQGEISRHKFAPEIYQTIRGIFGRYGAIEHINHLAPTEED